MTERTTTESEPTTPRPTEYAEALSERVEKVLTIVNGLETRADALSEGLEHIKGLVGNVASATAEDLRAIKRRMGILDAELGGTIAVQREQGAAIESIRPKLDRAAAVADDARASVTDEMERLGGQARAHYEQVSADAKKWREHTTSIAKAEAEAATLRRRLRSMTALAIVTGVIWIGQQLGPPAMDWIVRLIAGG